MDNIKAAITAEIKMTNNGKLRIENLPRELRQYVPGLIAAGYLSYATFLQFHDAIKLTYTE